MTAPRITKEWLKGFRGKLTYSNGMELSAPGGKPIHADSIHDILDALESAYAELDRLSAQGGEVAEPDASIIRSQGFTTIWWTSNPCGEKNKENLERFLRENPGAVREDLWRRPAPPHPDTVEVSAEELGILRDAFGLLRTAWNTHALYDYQTVLAEAIIRKHDALRAQAQPATEREGA